MSKTKIVTGLVRFSYMHVLEPYAHNEGEDPKYSMSVLIKEDDKATLKKIDSAIKAAIEEGKEKHGWKSTKTLKLPLRDGEEREENEEYLGMKFLNASSKRRPQIVDASLNPIIDEDEIYSGAWGRVSLNFYPFQVSGNKGVAVGLNNIQKLKDDDRLGGSAASAEEDFDDGFGDDFDDEDL